MLSKNMTYEQIKQLNSKLYFTLTDVIGLLGIKRGSAQVLCSRYAREGRFLRLKNDFYITPQKWDSLTRDDLLKVCNFLQVPSYISCITALWVYGITTQVPRNFYESISLKRSKRFEANQTQFNYYKFKKELYFDFIKKDGIFIATPEKAFLDALYLYSYGKYKIDFSALDLGKLDNKRIIKLVKAMPKKARLIAKKICKI
jgi:predicted transcriptional regulator of viral defense system